MAPKKLINAASFVDLQDATKEGKVETVQECSSASEESSDSCDGILFNPNAFTEFKLAGSQDVSLFLYNGSFLIKVMMLVIV